MNKTDSLSEKMAKQAIGNLFNNTMMGKIALFAATVERHKHDMMQTNQPYKHVIWPIKDENGLWADLPGRKDIDFVWFIEDHRRSFNDNETIEDERFLVNIYSRFFEIVEEKWKNSKTVDELAEQLNSSIIFPHGSGRKNWQNMSDFDKMKYTGLEGYPNKGDERYGKRTSYIALCIMVGIYRNFVTDLENSRMEFQPFDAQEFDFMVNGIHHRNGRHDIVNEKGNPTRRSQFYLTGQKPA